ncbi:UNVERIFIED_CONTAM: hypothetical protein FKN15_029032, partial [Acipenser sinensis]
ILSRDMSSPGSFQLSFASLRMPFSDGVKYTLLGISVSLFAIAALILTWQLYQYFKRKPKPSGKIKSYQSVDDKQAGKTIFEAADKESDIQKHDYKRVVPVCRDCPGRYRLPVRDFSQSTNPFVKIKLLSGLLSKQPNLQCVLQEWETKTVKNSRNPVFGSQFSCPLTEKELKTITLKLEVRDFDRFSRHSVLGEVRVRLNNLNLLSHPVEISEELQKLNKVCLITVFMKVTLYGKGKANLTHTHKKKMLADYRILNQLFILDFISFPLLRGIVVQTSRAMLVTFSLPLFTHRGHGIGEMHVQLTIKVALFIFVRATVPYNGQHSILGALEVEQI